MKRSLLLISIIAMLSISDCIAQASFNTGALEISVSQYGRIRLFTPDGTRHLQRASLLVGSSSTAVFDYTNDAEELEPTVLVANPAISDFEIYGAYDNAYSGAPPAVIEKMYAYGWTNTSYVIVKFRIINDESASISASIGLDIIPEINQEYGFDSVTYNAAQKVIRFHRGAAVNMGMKLLTASLSSLYSFEWYDGYEVDSDYWNWMHHGSLQPTYVSNTIDGPVTITAQDAVTLAPGQSVDVCYAMALGANETQMLANINAAELKFASVFVSIDEKDLLSKRLTMNNHPNPCNQLTSISYQLLNDGLVNLKVYDAMGNEVATLVNSRQSGGLHTIEFNTEGLAEGIYYYTIQSDKLVKTNKLVISR